MATTFPIHNLLEGDMSSFYRYSDSLTTPDCNEIVQVSAAIYLDNFKKVNTEIDNSVDCGA
jgi:carbonic anhydrase